MSNNGNNGNGGGPWETIAGVLAQFNMVEPIHGENGNGNGRRRKWLLDVKASGYAVAPRDGVPGGEEFYFEDLEVDVHVQDLLAALLREAVGWTDHERMVLENVQDIPTLVDLLSLGIQEELARRMLEAQHEEAEELRMEMEAGAA